MTTIANIKNQVMGVIHDDNYSVDAVLNVLNPIAAYVNDPVFLENVNSVITILTTDRDGNKSFTVKDLQLMSHDPLAMTSLISGILLVIAGIPQLKLRYDAGATEELVFKVLAYVFLIVVPKQTNQEWTVQEKEDILNITLVIYQFIQSSQATQQLVANITNWFKSTKVCSSFCGGEAVAREKKQAVVNKQLPIIQAQLSVHMDNIREKREMSRQISKLKLKTRQLRQQRKSDSAQSIVVVDVIAPVVDNSAPVVDVVAPVVDAVAPVEGNAQ